MAEQLDSEEFTFSWLALKLLGRGLYSNPWSALSELVANGIDAGATTVYVHIDTTDKSRALVEVIDDGTGMTREEIATYVKVGHNKRTEGPTSTATRRPMGRKGIGKLAALFLSSHFFISTRSESGETSWELNASDEVISDDDKPQLFATTEAPATSNDEIWNSLGTGTRLRIVDVDLSGYGPKSISALGSRLANQFLLPDNGTPAILLWVQSGTDTEPNFSRVSKRVAFRNFAEIAYRFDDNSVVPDELSEDPPEVLIPATGLPGETYRHQATYRQFSLAELDDESLSEIGEAIDTNRTTYLGQPYSLTGWIGVHATIRNEAAQENDERFEKNKYYNPAQIRVYVRGKLASDRLLAQLGLTGTYANYLEGELSFDLLDDDDLPDIATANRQDFDETDGRVVLLKALTRPIARSLMQNRNELAKTISQLEKDEKNRRDSVGKQNFAEQVGREIDHFTGLAGSARDEFQTVIVNKIVGDITPKSTYRVFISHSSDDVCFASFIDQALRDRGARKDEIFFTSREGDTDLETAKRALSTIIRENIVDANTLIFYVTSRNFLGSQYCLFEGGAGWATRSVGEYLKLNVEYSAIPKFLSSGESEVSLLKSGKIALDLQLNNYIIRGVLNPMIDHLNLGRRLDGQEELKLFLAKDLPTKKVLAERGESEIDYLDEELVKLWDAVVAPCLPEYLNAYVGEDD